MEDSFFPNDGTRVPMIESGDQEVALNMPKILAGGIYPPKAACALEARFRVADE